MKMPGIGITGLGAYLPPEKRTNDFWSAETVRQFKSRADMDLGKFEPTTAKAFQHDPKLIQIIKEETARWKDDPFHGAVERRVAPPGMLASEMEYEAAKAALADAKLEAKDVDLVLVQSFIPDQPISANPSVLHNRLGLSGNCPAIGTDPTCSGFLFQMTLASAYLNATGGKNALLVQSTMFSRVLDYSVPLSTTFGDAASAVVLGRVSKQDRGLLAIQSFANSDYTRIASIDAPKGDPWYEGKGPLKVGSGDREKLKDLPELSAAAARDSIAAVLKEANLEHRDVAFFTSHQPTSSFSTICQRSAGLEHARKYDSFSTLGAISGCVTPVNMLLARKEGVLRANDIAVLFTTGNGVSWNAAVLRWGD